MARYEALSPSPLTGNESLTVAGSHLLITGSDFWRWAFSDLVTNTTRGYLAEFIVGTALDLPQAVRAPWRDYDLITASGLKIEVKSCWYLQAWGHDELSRISFSSAPRTGWDAQTGKSGTVVARKADVYVFCLLHHQDKPTLNPLDLAQWTFYVVPTTMINRAFPLAKALSLQPRSSASSESLCGSRTRAQTAV